MNQMPSYCIRIIVEKGGKSDVSTMLPLLQWFSGLLGPFGRQIKPKLRPDCDPLGVNKGWAMPRLGSFRG